MRDAFSAALVRLARADDRVLLLTGDHGYALFDRFREECATQYVNAGIAEQNMVGMAAGLAREGFIPFVYGLAAFVPIRTLEQVKLDIAHDGLHVVLLGDGAGFVYSHLGTSHQSTEDIAAVRAVPGLQVLSPADRFEMTACMVQAYEGRAPVYLRMGKSDRGDVHADELPPLQVGRPIRVRTGSAASPVLIATGSMVVSAVRLAADLDAAVWSVPYVKPLDGHALLDAVAGSSEVIVLEEHSVHGGLGSAVTEVLSELRPTRVLCLGVRDRFSEHCGSYDYLLREHGLDDAASAERIQDFLAARR